MNGLSPLPPFDRDISMLGKTSTKKPKLIKSVIQLCQDRSPCLLSIVLDLNLLSLEQYNVETSELFGGINKFLAAYAL